MLSWLVLGVGDITRKRVLPAILAEPRSRLCGIVTRDPAKAEPYGVKSWSGLTAALEESGATAVYVATPVFLHAAQTVEALRSGCHVLCEKPMAMNYADAVAMQRASEESRRTLGIAYYRRMYPQGGSCAGTDRSRCHRPPGIRRSHRARLVQSARHYRAPGSPTRNSPAADRCATSPRTAST